MNIIKFKCKCISDEASCIVRYRKPDEDILDWMEDVQEAVSDAHSLLSPRCRETALEYAKLPAPESADGIGGKPRLNS